MEKRNHSIVEITNGRFDVVATGLTWVDAMNQSMTLDWQVGGTFRQVRDGMTADEYRDQQRSAANNSCPVQAAWAYL